MNEKKQFSYRYTQNSRQKIYTDSPINIGKPLPNTPYLSIMVWNIYKQQKLNWLAVLNEYGRHHQLVLLQEAQSSQQLIDFATKNYLIADQVPAIKFPKTSAGVMTLAVTYPVYCQSFRKPEPILRLLKSALITVYPTYDAKLLMVINIHSVNFTIGTDFFADQITAIVEHVMRHDGPVIFAGDFNTWSRQRLHLLYQFARKMGLKPVTFEEDYRKTIFKRPIDFLFYRGLKLEDSKVIQTDASDHNPLIATFKRD